VSHLEACTIPGPGSSGINRISGAMADVAMAIEAIAAEVRAASTHFGSL
jgi:hypothetical protein